MPDFAPAPGRLRDGLRLYAIGDVHGCLDRLLSLHGKIAGDMAAHPARETVLIHIGDYIDRGPDSAGVLQLLMEGVAPEVTRRVDLQGNHESMMLGALDDEEVAGMWLANGGSTTLESYGATGDGKAQDWASAVPSAHRHWAATRHLTHQEGDYLFVHAGIRPGCAIARQSPEDLLWIREPFLSSGARHPFVIVHGHTPCPAPELRPNRIGIDTGAVMGGALTCLVLEEAQARFLTA